MPRTSPRRRSSVRFATGEGFDPRRGEPVEWLIGIARRCISDHFAQRPIPVVDLPEVAAPGELATDSAARIDLHRAVAGLAERDRELVALRYGADLTARQIGELLELADKRGRGRAAPGVAELA